MHILTFSTLFPNAEQPVHGLFIRNRMESYMRKFGHEWSVVAPVPYFPNLVFKSFLKRPGRKLGNLVQKCSPKYFAYSQVLPLEKNRGYPVYHPRYLVTPVFGMRYYGIWMARGAAQIVREIHTRHPIDLIDAHYIYPDATAALALGRELNIPVVISARGTDLNLFTKMADIAPLIRQNLTAARKVICVSGDLARIAKENGAPSENVVVIGNGIDPKIFHPLPSVECRKKLGLPLDKKILLSVGHLVNLKGFHFILEALAQLEHSDVALAIVGEGAQRSELESLAEKLGLKDRFFLPGAIAQDQLPQWYAAADLFVLMSSREGWPNVVCEAQAMGLPVIATRVGAVEDMITGPREGLLLAERTASALTQAIKIALGQNQEGDEQTLENLNPTFKNRWSREHIAQIGQRRTWDAVAEALDPIFRDAIRS